MMSKKRAAVIITGVVSLVALALAGGAYALHLGPWEEPEVQADLGPVIATVDGQPITLQEARSRVEGLSTVHGNIEDMLGEDWPEQVMQSLVDDKILREQAAALGITVTDQDIQDWVGRVQEDIGTGQTLDQWLASQGMTMPEFERRIELQLIGARVYLTVTKDVSVTPEEIHDYYREHRMEYADPDGTVPPLLQIRQSVRKSLLKEQQDAAYAAWLDDVRANADVVVVIDDWWRNVT